MPENDGELRRIRILVSVATFIFNEARGLFIAGSGEDIHGQEVGNVTPEIDTIPQDTDGYRWANAMLRFLRYVAHTLQYALQEEHELNQRAILGELDNNIDDFMGSQGEI